MVARLVWKGQLRVFKVDGPQGGPAVEDAEPLKSEGDGDGLQDVQQPAAMEGAKPSKPEADGPDYDGISLSIPSRSECEAADVFDSQAASLIRHYCA